MKTIRIAAGQGFWGDWTEAPLQQVQKGPIDYLILDYLAELTMSILAKQKAKDASLGYAKDFIDLVERLAPEIINKNIKIIANAGGLNPQACAVALQKKLNQKFEGSFKVAAVFGDNITDSIESLQQKNQKFVHLDSGAILAETLSATKQKVVSANAYLGSAPIVEALKEGANIIVTGRVADASLALAPMIYEFSWSATDWDRLALGTIAGHLIECGAQSSGGNCSFDWQNIPDLAEIGYPIIEISEDLNCIITKHPNTGGRVDLRTVKEQLVYEIGDPVSYITPDVIADFTSVSLEQIGSDRVSIKGARGRAATDSYKVSLCYTNGFKAEGTLLFSAPQAKEKAATAGAIIKTRLAKSACHFDDLLLESIGLSACHGSIVDSKNYEPPEVMLRVAGRSQDLKSAERLVREIVPLVLSGPPGATGYAGVRPKPMEVYSYWPTLIDKNLIQPKIELIWEKK